MWFFSMSVVLNLWGVNPEALNIRYLIYQKFKLQFIAIAKLHLGSRNKIYFMFVDHYNMKICSKILQYSKG